MKIARKLIEFGTGRIYDTPQTIEVGVTAGGMVFFRDKSRGMHGSLPGIREDEANRFTVLPAYDRAEYGHISIYDVDGILDYTVEEAYAEFRRAQELMDIDPLGQGAEGGNSIWVSVKWRDYVRYFETEEDAISYAKDI